MTAFANLAKFTGRYDEWQKAAHSRISFVCDCNKKLTIISAIAKGLFTLSFLLK
jgi:hypothetical protein